MYKLSILSSFMLSLFCIISNGQSNINQIDSQGKKQGYWVKKYPNNNKMYEGTFKDNKPVGELKRYFDDESLKALMVFNETGDSAQTTMYYQNGVIAAKGLYVNSKKHGSWHYYSFFDTSLVKVEDYIHGEKHGIEKNYYPNGNLAEIIHWKNNKKNGDWEQFYEDKKPKTKGSFVDGKINGSYYVYYSNSRPEVIGFYKFGKMDGIWQYFNPNGKIERELKFVNGKPENIDKLTEEEQEFFQMIEQNMGKFSDPTMEDVYR